MDIHGLKHMENILYREDDLKERIKLVHRWTMERELSLDHFTVLMKSCTVEQVERDKARRYSNEKSFKSVLSQYDFNIAGSHNHWYQFKFTDDFSIIYTQDDACNLVNQKFGIIKSFETPEKLEHFLISMF
jgi:hypothetical protein